MNNNTQPNTTGELTSCLQKKIDEKSLCQLTLDTNRSTKIMENTMI